MFLSKVGQVMVVKKLFFSFYINFMTVGKNIQSNLIDAKSIALDLTSSSSSSL